MNKKEWKENILKFVSYYGGATFANLMNRFGEAAKGEYTIFVPKCRNLVLWSNMSKELSNAIIELHAEKLIKFDPDSVFLYVLDGMILPHPVAYKLGDYPIYHWCPMVMYTTWRAIGIKQ